MKKTLIIICYVFLANGLFAQNDELSDNFKDVRLISQTSDTIRLSELLEQHSNQLILIDFWASWCSPCLQQMPYAKSLKKELENKPISFFYLSTDADHGAWLRMVEKQKLHANSYRIFTYDKEVIQNELNISGIPHYLLLGKSHRIIKKKAPWPSSRALSKLINKHL